MNSGVPSNPIAYLILAHKSPKQLHRLMRAIFDPANYYAIHIDRTAALEVHKAAAEIAASSDRVQVLPSINCRHAGFSLVKAQQRGIRALIRAGADWSHFINLSGEDFPLHAQATIMNRLASAEGINFVNVFDPWASGRWPDPDERYDGVYWEPPGSKRARRVAKLTVRRRWILGGAKLYGASQWMILSRDFCEFVSRRTNVWRYIGFFRNTYVPDESFYPTVLMNSKWRHRLTPENLRFVDWTSGPERPRILRLEDLDRLLSSGALFARKLNADVDESLLDSLERRVQ